MSRREMALVVFVVFFILFVLCLTINNMNFIIHNFGGELEKLFKRGMKIE